MQSQHQNPEFMSNPENFHPCDMYSQIPNTDLILYVPSTIFQLCKDGSSWVEPVLS